MHKLMQENGLATLLKQRLLGSTFAAQPVATLARLLVWMQKQQELLQLPSLDGQWRSAAARSSGSSNELHVSPYSMLWQASAKGGPAKAYIERSTALCPL
jgi:hypothetical protein